MLDKDNKTLSTKSLPSGSTQNVTVSVPIGTKWISYTVSNTTTSDIKLYEIKQ